MIGNSTLRLFVRTLWRERAGHHGRAFPNLLRFISAYEVQFLHPGTRLTHACFEAAMRLACSVVPEQQEHVRLVDLSTTAEDQATAALPQPDKPSPGGAAALADDDTCCRWRMRASRGRCWRCPSSPPAPALICFAPATSPSPELAVAALLEVQHAHLLGADDARAAAAPASSSPRSPPARLTGRAWSRSSSPAACSARACSKWPATRGCGPTCSRAAPTCAACGSRPAPANRGDRRPAAPAPRRESAVSGAVAGGGIGEL